MSNRDKINEKLGRLLGELEENLGKLKEGAKGMSHPIDRGVMTLTVAVSEEAKTLAETEVPTGAHLVDQDASNYVTAFRAMEALSAARDRIVEARGHLAICEAAVRKLISQREEGPESEPAPPPDDQNLN